MAIADSIPPSSGEQVYQRLRTDIVLGRLAPGGRLRIDALRAQYGAGIGTLREILSRLAAEGLVHAEEQRGFAVPPVTIRGFREIAELRLILESHALAQSFAGGDVDWEGRVVAAHHKLAVVEARMLAGGADTGLWKRYDGEFHQALISACGSRELMAAHAGAFDRYLRFLMVAACFRGEKAAAEHDALRACALARDVAGAQAILAGHIGGCVDHVVASTGWPEG
jgi:DNA-binding GntR family transcriptional regulator